MTTRHKRGVTAALGLLIALSLALPASAGGYGTTTTTTTEATTTTEPTTTTTEPTTTTTEASPTTTTPKGVCVDANTATASELQTVQGVDFTTALAIIEVTSFDRPFGSVAELIEAMGLGHQVLEPVFPDWPGYFADACLSAGLVQPPTTTTQPDATTTEGEIPTTTTIAAATVETLPFTGPPPAGALAGLAAALVGLGLVLVLALSEREE